MSMEPLLKWPGGKRWLAGLLVNMYGPHKPFRRLVEPFVGSMAVTMVCEPRFALLNDANVDLMNFYRHVIDGLTPRLLVLPYTNDEAIYYRHRERFNTLRKEGLDTTAEAAALFYYLNRTGFHGLVRYNTKGEYNVPFGHYKHPPLKETLRVHGMRHRRKWMFACGDFANLELEPGDFIYADPPYDGAFDAYTVEGFSWEDQIRLVDWLVEHPGPVVLSNNATDRIVNLYESHGFEITRLNGRGASIALTADTRPDEILATRGIVLPQPRLF